MKNSDRFLDAFKAIEGHLRKLEGADRGTAFSRVVKEAAKRHTVVWRHRDDLLDFAQLRNAIVHLKRGEEVIAEPNDRTVAEIELIAGHLTDPPKVIPMFQTNVFAVQVDDPVASVVKSMYEHSFSQAPVYDRGQFVGLLTTNSIARWLGALVSDDVFSLGETEIGHVLRHAEETENHSFLSRRASLFDVLDRFEAHARRGKRLEAILITDKGRSSEKLLGIMTIWDLPNIEGALKRPSERTGRKGA